MLFLFIIIVMFDCVNCEIKKGLGIVESYVLVFV